ncbi:MAG TPA: hypothetical protein VEK08_19625 [Planctomycetota bacterium]|nr:hypothetical protein [Planctomycetota bacterium]
MNITDDGWPDNLTALWPWKLYHTSNPISKYGFTAIVLLTPDGKKVLAGAESAGMENWKSSEHYHGEKFAALLDKGLEKFKAVKR